jgi:DNA-binding NarL/FixJ family response regulator
MAITRGAVTAASIEAKEQVEEEIEMASDEEIQRLVGEFGVEVSLSPRQLEIVTLAVGGLARKEIAFRLGCSLKTIEGYWRRIYEKAGCRSDAEVVARFIRIVIFARFRSDAVAEVQKVEGPDPEEVP